MKTAAPILALLLLVASPLALPGASPAQDPAPAQEAAAAGEALGAQVVPTAQELGEALLEAAQRNDLPKVRRLLDQGADVDFKTRYGATALFFAGDKGNVEMVKLLLERGAEINLQDTFYQASPLAWASFNLSEGAAYEEIVVLLLEKGAEEAGQALSLGVRSASLPVVKAAVATGRVDAPTLRQALAQAEDLVKQATAPPAEGEEGAEAEPVPEEILASRRAIAGFLAEKAPEETPGQEPVKLSPEQLAKLTGDFKNEDVGMAIKVYVEGEDLKAQGQGQPPLTLDASSETEFSGREVPGIDLAFHGRGGLIEGFTLKQSGQEMLFVRAAPEEGTEEALAEAAEPEAEAVAEAAPEAPKRTDPLPWPSFRGPAASGIGDGQGAPVAWNGEEGKNVRWKTEIPGIALSSPVVWGEKVFVTTAVSDGGDDTFRIGLYGDVDSVEDDSVHTWKLYALSKASGEILWQKDAVTAKPETKRHLKSSQANPTPATDGRYVVAHFGSEGIYCYTVDGELVWKKDFGVLSSGWFYDASYEWGFSSSPILYDGKVILQTDVQKGSFIAAYDLATGKEIWKTERDEIPTWGTPNVLPTPGDAPDEVVTNGTTVRGYSVETGEELWTLAPNSEITVGTPVIAEGMAYVTGGYPPARPIYAIRPGGRGDLSLPEGETASEHIAWSVNPGGTYIPTPIVYRGILYMLNNNGRLAAYDAATGERIYRERVGQADSFSGSPVAADGRLYLTSEQGRTFVVKAGRTYELLETNELGEVVMTTPAISDGLLIFRGMEHVYGLGEDPGEESSAEDPASAAR